MKKVRDFPALFVFVPYKLPADKPKCALFIMKMNNAAIVKTIAE